MGDLSAQLAIELAAGLSSEETLRERYGLDMSAWQDLTDHPTFKSMLSEAHKTLTGDLNAKNRIKLKASVAFEDTIPTIYNMAHDVKVPAASRLEAAKILSRVGGVDAQHENTVGGTGFSISINLGSSNQPITINGSKVDNSDLTSMPPQKTEDDALVFDA